MELQYHTKLAHENTWAVTQSVRSKGKAFLSSRFLENKGINNYFELCTDFDDFVGRIKKLNGFFSVIIESNDRLMLAVDITRSMPLFYAMQGRHAYVSNDAHWIREQLGMPEFDPFSLEEFMMTGFVVGANTLCSTIKQLQAGEAICLAYKGSSWIAQTIKYRQFRCRDPYDYDEEDLLKLFDEKLMSAFDRALRVVGNRQIVLPLSGGYDSRLIALMLKKLGYSNVQLFSYGTPDNQECVIAKTIARALGYHFHYITYDNYSWRYWVRTKEWTDYFRSADNLCSLPHLQDWPALWELKENGLASLDSVFIAGHGGDSLAGSFSGETNYLHLLRFRYPDTAFVTDGSIVLKEALFSEEQFILSILRHHYILNKWPSPARNMVERYTPLILNAIGGLDTHPNWASAYDAFNLSERQPKFIMNSLRAAEYWGYSWWMPFFDRDYISFWESVPIKFRNGERLYVHYIDRLYKKLTGQDPIRLPNTIYGKSIKLPSLTQTHIENYLKPVWRGPFFKHLRKAYHIHTAKQRYYSDKMGWSGIVNEKTYINYYLEGKSCINSLLIANYLGELSF